MAEQVIKFRYYNLSFNYGSVLEDYLNTNYGGTYQCVGINKYSYNRMRYLDEDFNEEDLEEGDTISKFARMRNINTNEIINMEMYYDTYEFSSIKVYLTSEAQKLFSRTFSYPYTNAYPTVQDRGETIFNILIAEQQMENEVSPNVKQVIQNSDLNRYLMGFI
jgi:hypothetical protein